MIGSLAPLLVLSLLSGFSCLGPVPTINANHRSRVLALRRTAIMDTVTAILDGQVLSLCTQQPVPATVQLTTTTTNFQAVATPDGKFRFFHIPVGDYSLTVTCPSYTKLADAPVHLGTGDAAETTIGMGCQTAKLK